MVAEYYHDGQGLTNREWSAYEGFVSSAQQALAAGNPQPLVLANAQFTPLNMSRNYSFVRVLWPIRLNRLELETIAITSLRDGSSVIQPTLTKRLGLNVHVYVLYSPLFQRQLHRIRKRSDQKQHRHRNSIQLFPGGDGAQQVMQHKRKTEPIAIIGIGCRFADAADPE